MPIYISPTGNPEIWAEKPQGYFTAGQWRELHPSNGRQAELEAEISQIKGELIKLDLASIRSLRAIENGAATDEDHQKLSELRQRAESLRESLRPLMEENDGHN